MRTLFLLLLTMASASICPGANLWYNGDFDGRWGFCSAESQPAPGSCQLYDDFIVPAGGWIVNSVYTNAYAVSYGTPAAEVGWQIRSGVSTGDGGILVASGVSSDITWTDTGNTYEGAEIYSLRVNGLNQTLAEGTYWLTIYGISGTSWGAILTTSGGNAIGSPQGDDGLSYINYPIAGFNFTPVGDWAGPGTWDFVLGVDGTSGASGSVPEPATFGIVGGAFLVLGLLRRRLA